MSTPTPTQSAATNPQRVHWSQHISGAQSIWLGKRLSRLVTLAALSISTTLTTGCRPGAQGNASPTHTYSDGDFRWTITRLEGATPETQVGWLDNETVLFIGTNHSTNGSPEISGLYAWDRKSPAKLVLADAYRFCFDGKTWTAQTGEEQNGKNELIYRRYRLNPSNLSSAWIGPDEIGSSKGFPNPYTCRDEEYPVSLRDRHWTALRPQDGYLDFGTNGSRDQDVYLISPDFRARRSLGFKKQEPTGRRTNFSRYSEAYIVYDYIFSTETLATWNRTKRFTIHSITPKGRAQPINVIPGPWSAELGGDRSIEPIKLGIAISSKAGRKPLNTESGLYLISDNKHFAKIDGSAISNPEASPDGCKLAYIQTIHDLEIHLKTADFCAQSEKSNETRQRTPA